MKRINAWTKCDNIKIQKVMEFNEGYRTFLSECKTERECVTKSVEIARKNGYVDIKDIIKEGRLLKTGDKVYAVNKGKALMLVNIGKQDIENGLRILGAHVDSPRLDIKQNPLYEDEELVLLDTHYYGGIKKYQWTAVPLALHGVVVLTNGTTINVTIGEDMNDPVVGVSDLLIHLAAEQMDKKAAKVVEGENLDILVGSMPMGDENGEDDKDKTKKYILRILKDKYGFEEEDFMSAELEAVPAGPARNMGIDNSMIMGYGQDDRVCAYTSLMAMLEVDNPDRTTVCLLVDKEEIGSVGATGMTSRFFENTMAELLNCMGIYSELILRRVLANSWMLSSDVNAAYDPNYPSVFEKKNASYLGRGIVFCKFTGARGKSGSNDANAEFVASVRAAMERDDVAYQMAELGKVDVGGGGTIAYILAEYGMEVMDCGVAVLNMHAPYEVTSKIDIFETYRGYLAFLK